MEMNETRQNCEEKANRQITEKDEQRCMNDSKCSRCCDLVSQKASRQSLPETHVFLVLAKKSKPVAKFCDETKNNLRTT
jgi:hypothetical protein